VSAPSPPKLRRRLAEAERIARSVVAELDPYCERLQVAGSVRRRTEMVGDIELVAIPHLVPDGLFGDRAINVLAAHLWAVPSWTIVKGGRPESRYTQLELGPGSDCPGLRVDLFLADAHSWGWILLMRTGSAEFSRGALSYWKMCKQIPREQAGSVDGRLVLASGAAVSTPTEESIFAALGLRFIPPTEREVFLPHHYRRRAT